MRFLIVDDNPRMRQLIADILQHDGLEVLEGGDGEAAVALHAAGRPDCVLMDVLMPGVDGIEATRRIIASDPDARIVIVTDCDDPEVRRAALDAGAKGFVLKEDLLHLRSLLLPAPSP